MKHLSIFIFILFSLYTNAQNFCIDSSAHFQYRTLLNDSIRIQKTILAKGGSKIFLGYFFIGRGERKESFICKINSSGEVEWFKKIVDPVTNDIFYFDSFGEAANGNIFTVSNSATTDATKQRFFYLIFSPKGDLLFQNKFRIKDDFIDTDAAYISMISEFGTDSMLVVVIHAVNATTQDGMTLITISNDGQIGQAITYTVPNVTSYSSYYNKCKIEGNILSLYEGTHFYNSCRINFNDQPAYARIQIDWNTKEVISKKAVCSPPIGLTEFRQPLGEGWDNNNTQIFPQDNGNVVYSRRIWGLDYNGGDTLTRIFKISEFDKDFNHIKSEYICTRKRFKWWLDWNYELYIDSFNKQFLYAHDVPNKEISYASRNSNGAFSLQKKISHSPGWNKHYTDFSQLFAAEAGYFFSLNVTSFDAQYTYLDNFRILAKDTGSMCFGMNTDFLIAKPATVSPIEWQGDFTFKQAVIEQAASNFTTEDYQFQRTVICNIVNKCDTLKLNAPAKICAVNQPVLITAHKNPLCNGKINFTFDTSQAQSYTQVNDTTLSLHFNKSYRGKVFAQSASCDKLKDSIEITITEAQPAINLGRDTLYCPGHVYSLTAFNPNFTSYQWQDGSTGNAFIATTSGTYYVKASDICGRIYTDTIKILPSNYQLKIAGDTTICLSESTVLKATDGFINYTWEPMVNLSLLTNNKVEVQPTVTTSYIVKAEKFTGCFLSDTVFIKVENCPQYIYFPSSFTPNNDGLNDSFKPLISGATKKYELTIFNRWGNLVFKTNNKEQGWNGIYRSIRQYNGVFVWYCNYQFYDKPEAHKKGTFVLLK